MMIDASKQGRGYGRAGLEKVIAYIQTKPFGNSCRVALTCYKDNTIALKLYRKMGFTETSTEDEDEIELSMMIL